MTSYDINIHDLEFGYAAHGFELHVPSLLIREGEQVAVVGASGCGKTTLAYLISGIYVPSSGSVNIGGQCISKMSDAARRNFRISNIGLIFQEFELLEYLRVEENILLPYWVNSALTFNKSSRQRARSLARSVGLGDKLHRYPGELSQGEKQRLAICRALITDPNILMADEPTGNLDAGNTESIMQLIRELARERGMTFMMITHEHGLLEQFDHVIDLEKMNRESTS
jgi:putative ABC transport system ATP-binding protein